MVRGSLNVPLENGRVVNDYRLRRALPTLQFLCEQRAKVVLVSHLGEKGTETLQPVAEALGALIPNVSFCAETTGANVRSAIREMTPGHILVLENLRRNKGETGNDPAFAAELATLADVFVQDSFDTCHRSHASMVGVPKLLPSYAGLLLEEEVAELTAALTPEAPSLAVIGGAKFSTKEAVLTALLKKYDHVFVGGALANDFLKAKGQNVGKSLVSGADTARVEELLTNPKLVIPVDSVVANDMILDHGVQTSALLADLAEKAKTILWNGPLGKFEDGYGQGTEHFARAVAGSGARSIVGGGDTVAAIEKLGLLSKFSFVSTGGGAMNDFLADGSLVGIDALNTQPSA
jgi:phosphoglycerate kinase